MVAIDGLAGTRGRPDGPGRPGTIWPAPPTQRPCRAAAANAPPTPSPSSARRNLEAGRLPIDRWGPAPAERRRRPGQPARPPGSLGGELGWGRPHGPGGVPAAGLRQRGAAASSSPAPPRQRRPRRGRDLAGRLRAATARLPRVLGGAPSQPLDRRAAAAASSNPASVAPLAVRDGGCVFPDCTRPLAWCEGHHLWHWLDGGPTDLANLALLCRAHHRAVHEGGWHSRPRGPDRHFTATPPHRKHRTGQPTAA